MSNSKKISLAIILVAIVLAAVILLPREQSSEIRIGVVLPLTGPSASHGQDAMDGLTMALEEINAAPPIEGRTIQLLYEDNQSRPGDAVSATKKLINADRVRIVIGPISSTNTLAMLPITEAAGVLLFSPAASSPEISGKGKLFFRTSLLAGPQGIKAAQFTFRHLQCSHVAILFIDDDTGRAYSGSFENEFGKIGGTVVAKESYEKTDTDFRTQITKIRAKDAKVVYAPAIPRTLGLIIKQCHELGYDPVFVSNYGSEGEDLIRIAGELANDQVYLTSFRLDPNFVAHYRSRFGKQPGIAAPLGYDALHVLARAIRDTQSTSPTKLAERLRSLEEHIGATGKFSFDEMGEPVREIIIRGVSEGTFQEIAR